MQIFEHERKAGLADILANPANAKIQYTTPINFDKKIHRSIAKSLEAKNLKAIKKAVAASDDKELYPLNSIMVSLGWNLNDDVFLKSQVWASRRTPEDKPLNIGHEELEIVGHIIGNYVVDDEGNEIPDDCEYEDLPDMFHMVAKSVMYRFWQDEKRCEKVNAIINEIEAAFASGKEEDVKWYVSMECLFNGFDYAIIGPEGEVGILERSEETSFLTSCLRAYGGTGKYGDYRIGRAIKNLSFSGLGIVENPANPGSIIFNGVLSFRGTTTSTINDVMEKIMANENKVDANEVAIKELQSRVEALVADKKDLEAKIVALETKVTEAENVGKAALQSVETVKAEKEILVKQVETLEADKKVLSEQLVGAVAKAEAAEKSLAEIEAAKVAAAREAILVEKGLTKEEAQAKVKEFASLDDAVFTAVASLVKKSEVVKPAVETAIATVVEGGEVKPEVKPIVPEVTEASTIEKTRAALQQLIRDEVVGQKNKKKN